MHNFDEIEIYPEDIFNEKLSLLEFDSICVWKRGFWFIKKSEDFPTFLHLFSSMLWWKEKRKNRWENYESNKFNKRFRCFSLFTVVFNDEKMKWILSTLQLLFLLLLDLKKRKKGRKFFYDFFLWFLKVTFSFRNRRKFEVEKLDPRQTTTTLNIIKMKGNSLFLIFQASRMFYWFSWSKIFSSFHPCTRRYEMRRKNVCAKTNWIIFIILVGIWKKIWTCLKFSFFRKIQKNIEIKSFWHFLLPSRSLFLWRINNKKKF